MNPPSLPTALQLKDPYFGNWNLDISPNDTYVRDFDKTVWNHYSDEVRALRGMETAARLTTFWNLVNQGKCPKDLQVFGWDWSPYFTIRQRQIQASRGIDIPSYLLISTNSGDYPAPVPPSPVPVPFSVGAIQGIYQIPGSTRVTPWYEVLPGQKYLIGDSALDPKTNITYTMVFILTAQGPIGPPFNIYGWITQ